MLNRFRSSLGLHPCGVLLLSWLISGSAAAVDLSGLALTDQFGAPGGLSTGQPGLQIAIVVSAKRLRRLKPWEKAIRQIDTEVPLIRVADVPRTAPTDLDTVATKLKKRLPEDLSVLIDLEGVWAQAYDLDVSVPNVLIFDGNGELVALHSGMYRKNYFDALSADLAPDSEKVLEDPAATDEVVPQPP